MYNVSIHEYFSVLNVFIVCIRNTTRSKSIPLLWIHVDSYKFSTVHPPSSHFLTLSKQKRCHAPWEYLGTTLGSFWHNYTKTSNLIFIIFWTHSQISSKHVSSLYLLLQPQPNYIPLKCKCLIKIGGMAFRHVCLNIISNWRLFIIELTNPSFNNMHMLNSMDSNIWYCYDLSKNPKVAAFVLV
jgi:hypothetical protein